MITGFHSRASIEWNPLASEKLTLLADICNKAMMTSQWKYHDFLECRGWGTLSDVKAASGYLLKFVSSTCGRRCGSWIPDECLLDRNTCQHSFLIEGLAVPPMPQVPVNLPRMCTKTREYTQKRVTVSHLCLISYCVLLFTPSCKPWCCIKSTLCQQMSLYLIVLGQQRTQWWPLSVASNFNWFHIILLIRWHYSKWPENFRSTTDIDKCGSR